MVFHARSITFTNDGPVRNMSNILNRFETLPMPEDSDDRLRLLYTVGTGKCMSYAKAQALAQKVQTDEYMIHADPTNGDWSEWMGSLERKGTKMGSMRLRVESTTAMLDRIEVDPFMADHAVPIFLCYFLCVLEESGIMRVHVTLPSSQYVGPLESIGFIIRGLEASIEMTRLRKECGW